MLISYLVLYFKLIISAFLCFVLFQNMLSINQANTDNAVIVKDKSSRALNPFLAKCAEFVTDNITNVRKPQRCS